MTKYEKALIAYREAIEIDRCIKKYRYIQVTSE